MGSKISCFRKNEEEEIIDSRNISEKVVEDKNKNKESRKLSLLGLECILDHFEVQKRLDLSLYYPRFRTLEKQCHLTLRFLEVHSKKIEIDWTRYTFDSDNNYIHESVNGEYQILNLEIGVFQFVQMLFEGRTRFRVGRLQLGIEIPFKLSIDCDTVHVDHHYEKAAAYYSNVVRKVDRLLIYCLHSSDVLDYPWARNVDIVELHSTNVFWLLPFLPDIPAKTIIVELNSPSMKDLIEAWCETRNGRVGSQLFMIMEDLRKNLNYIRLPEMGLVAECNERWRLPMNDNFQATLSIRDDYLSFRKLHLVHTLQFDEYLCLEVVSL